MALCEKINSTCGTQTEGYLTHLDGSEHVIRQSACINPVRRPPRWGQGTSLALPSMVESLDNWQLLTLGIGIRGTPIVRLHKQQRDVDLTCTTRVPGLTIPAVDILDSCPSTRYFGHAHRRCFSLHCFIKYRTICTHIGRTRRTRVVDSSAELDKIKKRVLPKQTETKYFFAGEDSIRKLVQMKPTNLQEK